MSEKLTEFVSSGVPLVVIRGSQITRQGETVLLSVSTPYDFPFFQSISHPDY